jgi:predicted dehydrogenase/threonine dehydrogenase-like Zn-dependent dehydrogenase
MKQVLENFRTGECYVEDVPAPVAGENFVLVRNCYSLISSGTEGGTVKLGKMSLLGKARARPEQVRKVLQVVKTQGLAVAWNAAMRTLDMPIVLGYSTAGVVIGKGRQVDHVEIGDRVACGGAGYANHAEIVCVPKNLCVRIPEGAATREAAFTTLGAIALQSVRVARAQLGDNVVLIGLGLVGLITAQLLKAAGCRVFGIDIDPERVAFLKSGRSGDGEVLGAGNLKERVMAWTSGKGADAVIITAATDDNGPVALAGELARIKGRVVAVGRTRLEAPRETYLFKELELCTSMAYGPGTGDQAYELKGEDYPYGYVRWTEGRNMAAVLESLASGVINFSGMITHEFPVEQADQAFALISGASSERSLAILLKYPEPDAGASTPARSIPLRTKQPATSASGRIGVAVLGAGSFATNEFLPLLCKQPNLHLRSICSATGVRAAALGRKYGFESCATDPETIFKDKETDCVFILTRHDTHAGYAAAALESGKHVFVEKPLALTLGELERVEQALAGGDRLLMVGFNRRYARLAVRMRDWFGRRAGPASIQYTVNVGYRPPEHWLHDPRQGGGVILGEACHQIDFCNWLIGEPALSVSATPVGAGNLGFQSADNIHISLRYADGSIAHIVYLSNGSKAYPAERCEVFCDNRVAVLTDFRKLEFSRGLLTSSKRLWFTRDKGHAGEIESFLNAIRSGQPVDTNGFLQSSRIAVLATAAVSASETSPLDSPSTRPETARGK